MPCSISDDKWKENSLADIVFNIRINLVPTRLPIRLRRGGEEFLDLILDYVTLAVVDSIKEMCLQWIGRNWNGKETNPNP